MDTFTDIAAEPSAAREPFIRAAQEKSDKIARQSDKRINTGFWEKSLII